MADSLTYKMLEPYIKEAMVAPFFLSTTQAVYHNQEKVSWDVQREDELIAPAIEIGTGANITKDDLYSAKDANPFYYNQGGVISPWELMGRNPGQIPFADNNFQAKLAARAIGLGMKNFRSVVRAMELQAAQVYTTGTITAKGVTLSFSPKSSHFPTVGTAWSNAAADMLGDIESLCDQILEDNLQPPDTIVFSAEDWNSAKNNTAFKAMLDNRRIEGSRIGAQQSRNGAKYHGVMEVGDYVLEMYTYNGRYVSTKGAAKSKYLPANRTVVMTSGAPIQSTFGAIPRVVSRDSRLAFIPERLTDENGFMDMSLWAKITGDDDGIMVSAGTRGLVVPKAIDSFGCITTVP